MFEQMRGEATPHAAAPALLSEERGVGLQFGSGTVGPCEKIFIEQMSGAVTNRPALREALNDARSGDTLITWKLDRLARSLKQLIETIDKLRLRNIGFRSLTEAKRDDGAGGLVFHRFSALAEFDRALARKRTRAELAAAKRASRTGGRPPKLTEDDLDIARTLLANPDIAVGDVGDRLGVSRATRYRYLPAARAANAPDGSVMQARRGKASTSRACSRPHGRDRSGKP